MFGDCVVIESDTCLKGMKIKCYMKSEGGNTTSSRGGIMEDE